MYIHVTSYKLQVLDVLSLLHQSMAPFRMMTQCMGQGYNILVTVDMNFMGLSTGLADTMGSGLERNQHANVRKTCYLQL